MPPEILNYVWAICMLVLPGGQGMKAGEEHALKLVRDFYVSLDRLRSE